MYAIVRNKDGTYYTSMVFGYFCKMTETDDYKRYLESIHNQFYLVLNEAKDCLIKKYVFPKENKYLDPQVLIVDTEQKDWILNEEHHGCASFLCGVDFDADELEVDPSILGKCIAMDTMQSYQEIVEVKSEADTENLCCVSGCFHDAYIKKCERLGDTVYVLFHGVWGCKIEMWFEGDADFCIDSRNPEYDDPSWYDSTLLRDNGYFYLVDECDMKVDDITDEYCWFKGRRLKYHVIPNG